MPYFVIDYGERVIADGQPGVVIALGSTQNKSAHYFVRLDGGKDIWYSKDEVVPEDYSREKSKEEQGKPGQRGRRGLGKALRHLILALRASRLGKRGE